MASKRGTIALGSFAVISVLLLYAGIDSTIVREEATSGINHVVELQESLTITDSVNAEILHPLVGTIQYSVDGEACYEVQEKIGVLYYRLLEECPTNV